MYYEINVSLNGTHFFATAERSLRDQEHAHRVAQELKLRFPKSQGFEISMVKWHKHGNEVEI